MKKTTLAGIFFLLLNPTFQEAFSSASSETEMTVDRVEEENPAYSQLSVERKEEQNQAVLELIANSKAVRESVELAQEERQKKERKRLLIYGDAIPEAFAVCFSDIQGAYEVLSNPRASYELRENTSRVKRGLVALAANLRGESVPEVPTDQGFTESEWPENEQDLWRGIQKLASQGYGDKKKQIHNFERAMFLSQSQRNGLKYIRYVFDGDYNQKKSSATDNSLKAFLAENEAMCQAIQDEIESKKISIGNVANEENNRVLAALENSHFWGEIGSVFILALDTAQTNGWDNWSRTCFVTAFSDALESLKASRSFS